MSMMPIRRRKLISLAAAGLLLATTACGSDGSDSDVEFWHIQTGTLPLASLFADFVEEFEESHEGSVRENPIDNDNFKSVLTTAMQSGSPPDIYHSWGGGVLQQQVEAGLVRDLTDDLADVIDTLSEGALAPYTINGKVYGLPFDMGMVGIWYNRALFAEAGLDPDNPPESWRDFLDAVDSLKDAGIAPIALAGAEAWTQHYWWSYLALRLAGVEGFEQARESRSFDSSDFVRAGELLKELADKEPFQSGFLGHGYGGDDSQAAVMGSGEAAMELMGQWAPSVQEEASGQSLGDDLGWFPFPAVEGGRGSITDAFGGGNGFAVGINASDTAIEFLRFIFTEENYIRILDQDAGLISVRDGSGVPEEPTRAQVMETVHTASNFQLYIDQDMPPAVGQQVNDSSAAIINGSATPEEAMTQITEVFQREPEFQVEE